MVECKTRWKSTKIFLSDAVKNLTALAIGASLLLSGAQAQTLQETLELTYRTNPGLKAQRAALRATDELAAQARAGRRPSANGSIMYEETGGSYDPPAGGGAAGDPTAGIFSSFSGTGTDNSTTAGIELQQPLFKGFRTFNSIREADARIDAAQAELIDSEQAVLSDAVAAYFSVVTNEESVKASEATLRSLERQRQAASVRFEVGQATRTDMAQAEARYAGADAQLISARSDLAAARRQFERVVGQMPLGLAVEPDLPLLPQTLEDALAVAAASNPQLLAAQSRLDASAYALRAARGLLSPSLTANATYGYVENQFIDGDVSERTTIGAQLTIPLYQGGATYSAIRQAREANKADRFALQDTERRVIEQVSVTWERVGATRATFQATTATIAASELALQGLILENQVGQRTTLDVLDGERELLNALLSNYQARERYYLTVFSLLRVMGQLTAQGLALGVDVYDAEVNKRNVEALWLGTGRSIQD